MDDTYAEYERRIESLRWLVLDHMHAFSTPEVITEFKIVLALAKDGVKYRKAKHQRDAGGACKEPHKTIQG